MFELKRQISYSQLSPDKTVSPTEYLRIFQDAAVAHTNACGYSLEKLSDLNRAWILLSTHLKLENPLYLDEEIIIKTWTYDFTRVSGPRAFIVESAKSGMVYASAVAMWAFVDTETGRPKEIPKDMLEKFGNGKSLLLPYIRRAPKFDTEIHIGDFNVLKRDLDSNGHMNNVRYVEYAMEAVPLDAEISELEVFYKHSTFYQDKISLHSKQDERTIFNEFKTKDGETCTYIRFILK